MRLKLFPAGEELHCPPGLPIHPIFTLSGQVSLPDRLYISQVRIPDVSFHKANYSRCSNTEAAPAGASKKRSPTKEPLGFYSLMSNHSQSTSSYEFSLLLCPSVSIHVAGTTLFMLFVSKRVGTSRPLVILGSHPELNLHLSLQFGNQATYSRCFLQQCSLEQEFPMLANPRNQ